jgi:CBS domain-containing protein
MQIMRHSAESLPADITVLNAIDRVRDNKFHSCLVTDGLRVLGVLNLSALQREVLKGGSQTIGDLVKDMNLPHVHADMSLDLALERMGANHLQVLPVVNRADVHDLLGVVTLQDVLDSYGLGNSDSDSGRDGSS